MKLTTETEGSNLPIRNWSCNLENHSLILSYKTITSFDTTVRKTNTLKLNLIIPNEIICSTLRMMLISILSGGL